MNYRQKKILILSSTIAAGVAAVIYFFSLKKGKLLSVNQVPPLVVHEIIPESKTAVNCLVAPCPGQIASATFTFSGKDFDTMYPVEVTDVGNGWSIAANSLQVTVYKDGGLYREVSINKTGEIAI